MWPLFCNNAENKSIIIRLIWIKISLQVEVFLLLDFEVTKQKYEQGIIYNVQTETPIAIMCSRGNIDNYILSNGIFLSVVLYGFM